MTGSFNMTVLFDTDTWIVLTRTPLAFGPFSNRKQAKLFAACRGGIALTWHEPSGSARGARRTSAPSGSMATGMRPSSSVRSTTAMTR
jgi:hypothetical protein